MIPCTSTTYKEPSRFLIILIIKTG